MKHFNWILGAILCISLILIIFRHSFFQPYLLNNEHKFTVGTVIMKNGPTSEGDSTLIINYIVNLKEYKCISGFVSNGNFLNIKINDRFYVKFYPPNPYNCKILLNKKVPDSIKFVPSKGWNKLPPVIDFIDHMGNEIIDETK